MKIDSVFMGMAESIWDGLYRVAPPVKSPGTTMLPRCQAQPRLSRIVRYVFPPVVQ